MCNPRRVEITATRNLAQAWQREVHRVAERSALITGQARICHALDAAIAAPALSALERNLDTGMDGWQEVETGYRHDVDGGHVIYSPDERTLEIVATIREQVVGRGEASAHLSGEVTTSVAHTAEAYYYDDNYAGRTEEVARVEARELAEQGADEQLRQHVAEVADRAAGERSQAVQEQANAAADAELASRSAIRRGQLDSQAEQRLATVGVQARHAFHRILALAYRDVLLALARARGAQNIQCNDSDSVLDIDFTLPD